MVTGTKAALDVGDERSMATPGRVTYIAVLPEGHQRWDEIHGIGQDTARSLDGVLIDAWAHALQGFALEIPIDRAAELGKDPRFEIVEKDGPVYLARGYGLKRIVRRTPCGRLGALPPRGGTGVDLYVIDSGVSDPMGTVFGNRLRPGYPAGATDDVEGHGTQVAALAAGSNVGISDDTWVVPVRVMGSHAARPMKVTVIAGVNWATDKAPTSKRPAIALMALSTRVASRSLDRAVAKSIAAGITYVVAAGNDNRDAGTVSPARVKEAITVGAIMHATCRCERRWQGVAGDASNDGDVVDLFAPGEMIETYDRDGSNTTIWATSAASAIVAGVAARYVARFSTGSYPSPADVEKGLTDVSSVNCIRDLRPGTYNRIAYALFDGSKE